MADPGKSVCDPMIMAELGPFVMVWVPKSIGGAAVVDADTVSVVEGGGPAGAGEF